MRPFEVGGEEIAVALFGGRFYAFSNICTHREAFLTDGFLIDGQIVCGEHEATYDVATGAILYGPAFSPLLIFSVRVTDGEVEIEWPHPLDGTVARPVERDA